MEVKNNNLHLYSLAQAAKLLGIGRDTLQRLIDAGKIGIIQTLKRKKIAHSELERFIKESTVLEQHSSEYSSGVERILSNPIKNKEVDSNKIFDSLRKEVVDGHRS
jgi:excisionase family DNA binding protein